MWQHRKLMPTAVERLIWGFGDGKTLGVVQSPVGRFGALICWENYMPLARMAMYRQGVELYCVPTMDDREAWIPTLRHIAREGRCFVLSSCQFLTQDAYPSGWLDATENLPEVPIRGGSCIVDPMGNVIARDRSTMRRACSPQRWIARSWPQRSSTSTSWVSTLGRMCSRST